MAKETLSDIIERETVKDEDEDGENPPTEIQSEDGEPTDEPAPEDTLPPMSDLDVERAFKQAEKEAAKYEARLEKVLGPIFADLQPSPIDDVPGYVFPFDPATDIGDYKRAAVASYFGDDAPPLLPDPDTETCARCSGAGEMLTGSKMETHKKRNCTDCDAVGWRFKPGKGPQAQHPPVPGEITPQSLDANGAGGEPDAFGRPWGDPKYGIIPQWTGAN